MLSVLIVKACDDKGELTKGRSNLLVVWSPRDERDDGSKELGIIFRLLPIDRCESLNHFDGLLNVLVNVRGLLA